MNPLIQLKQRTPIFLAAVMIACFGVLPATQAVVPAPDGGYPNGNTAEGQNALLSLTTGTYNTAVGYFSLSSNRTNSFNTAIGIGALLANTADQNTATGAAALFSNTTGTTNTANGAFTLFSNTTGNGNTANGAQALQHNTTGFNNTATGEAALFINTTGASNTATGSGALALNVPGSANTANGYQAIFHNNTGSNDTAIGAQTLFYNNTGSNNTAIGEVALYANTTGNDNTALGFSAGSNATIGNNNVYIGVGMIGVGGESNACYIASIDGQTSPSGVAVLINSSGKLGTTTSSRRFKEGIKPMDNASEALFALRPVTFRYKKQLDPQGIQQWGLVAEDVQRVNPALVALDKEGTPYAVRYDQVNAMLLNEFLKEHKAFIEEQRKVQELKANAARQQKQIEALTAGLQKVSAQLEMSKPAPQTVLNNQ